MAGYSKELMEQYMKEEQRHEEQRAREQAQTDIKKLKAAVEKANNSAKVAFEQTQQNRFEIESLKKSLKRTRIAALIASVLAIICMAMVMADGLSSLTATLP